MIAVLALAALLTRGGLDAVNQRVNGSITYRRTTSWAVAQSGDCKTYAMAKRQALIALGWPPEALHIARVHDERGEDHAILIVDFHSEQIVLDNRFNWTETLPTLERYGYHLDYVLNPFSAELLSKETP